MNAKTKDCVFSLALLALGAYVVVEGVRMVDRASRPPYNIDAFRISPGMLPVVLGSALLFFAVILLARSLRAGSAATDNSLTKHLRAASVRLRQALGEMDVRSMVVCTVIMFVYTFFVVGSVPFWLGGVVFLAVLMGYLRASSPIVILLTAGLSVGLLILLFEVFFKTTLP